MSPRPEALFLHDGVGRLLTWEAADAVLCRCSVWGVRRVSGACRGLHEPSTGASAHGPRGAVLTTVKASVGAGWGEGSGESGCPCPWLSLSQGRGQPFLLEIGPDAPQPSSTGMSVRRQAFSLVFLSPGRSRGIVSPPGTGQTTQIVGRFRNQCPGRSRPASRRCAESQAG